MPAKRLPPLDVGHVVAGKYRIDAVIGQGGMSTVLLAMHLSLDTPVAIKVLSPQLVDSPTIVERFTREARAAVKITSEHAARVLDVAMLCDDEGRRLPYMVMEYLTGADLATVLRRDGKLPGGQCVDYVMQCAEALAEAHARGLVHRDVKPANIFLAERDDGTVMAKLIDFGITKLSDGEQDARLTQTCEAIGSPRYMSPEQLRGSAEVDARSDIWSLGVTLYELLAGEPPFRGGSLAELHAAVLERAPRPLCELAPGTPQKLGAAVARCLRKQPEERFASLHELGIALAPFGSASAAASLEVVARWDRVRRRRTRSLREQRAAPAAEPADRSSRERAGDPLHLGVRAAEVQPPTRREGSGGHGPIATEGSSAEDADARPALETPSSSPRSSPPALRGSSPSPEADTHVATALSQSSIGVAVRRVGVRRPGVLIAAAAVLGVAIGWQRCAESEVSPLDRAATLSEGAGRAGGPPASGGSSGQSVEATPPVESPEDAGPEAAAATPISRADAGGAVAVARPSARPRARRRASSGSGRATGRAAASASARRRAGAGHPSPVASAVPTRATTSGLPPGRQGF